MARAVGGDHRQGVSDHPLRATQAARQLDVPTKEVLPLALAHKIRFVMVKGIAHFPQEAIDDYRVATARDQGRSK